jgi:hypothetical protein
MRGYMARSAALQLELAATTQERDKALEEVARAGSFRRDKEATLTAMVNDLEFQQSLLREQVKVKEKEIATSNSRL